MKFLGPKELAGREVLYVDGANDGDMLVRKGGRRNAYLKLWIQPDGHLAMSENRYPVSEFGFERLLRRIIEVAETDVAHGDSLVRYFENAKVDGRPCYGVEVTHPSFAKQFRFHVARVLIDDELGVPVHFASYGWPKNPGDELPLLEEYTYRQVRLNVGLADHDFDRSNPEYQLAKD